ncbi:MAG: hypothetical protein WC791_02935 [Candidatus Paceibacterota bacterium]|jgi:hypothetical protein
MKLFKTIILSSVLLVFLYSIFYIPNSASAFEATSTSFELHAGDIEGIVASSTSASFQLRSAAPQTAIATSTSATYSITSGILYWLFSWFQNRYDQIHYRWREDTDNEVNAPFLVGQDLQYPSFPKNTVKRLRFEVSNEGWTRSGSAAFTLEVASTTTCSSGSYATVPTDYSSTWRIATSTNFVDKAATTDVGINGGLDNENRTFVAGQILETSTTTDPITLTSSDFTEVEYAVMATDSANNGGTYCFRLTNSGATSGTGYSFGYSKYAVAIVAAGLPPYGTLDSAVFDTQVGTAGAAGQGAAYNSIMWNGSLNGGGTAVQFQLATSATSTGPWTFYGSSDNGATCTNGFYYYSNTPGIPVELSCAPTYHNNQRYFRYRVRLCSAANCSSSGTISPIVDDVVVNWAP